MQRSPFAATGSHEIFRSAISREFGGTFDSQPWTFFVPTDAALASAGFTDLTAFQLKPHIVVSSPLDPTSLAAAGMILASDNSEIVVATDSDGNTTVNGNQATFIATGAAGSQIYSIDGILSGTN